MNLAPDCNKAFKILQLDGGGLKGRIFLGFLSALEKKLGKSCHEIFDLVIGTSTGGITAGLIANGMSADSIIHFYEKHAKKIFKKRWFGFLNPTSWWSGKYNRKHIDSLCDRYMNFPMKNGEIQTIITGVNMKDARSTHFFKSYKDKYKDKIMSEMVKRTFSAPTYFGYYKDEDGIWSDGGVGIQTCTLLEAYIETLRQKKDDYWILSCGCGYTGLSDHGSFIMSQIADFIPIAREQSIQSQVNQARELSVNFTRLDIKIEKKYLAMDKPKYMKKYKEYGRDLIEMYIDQVVE